MKTLHAVQTLAIALIIVLILVLGVMQQAQIVAAPLAASQTANFAGSANSVDWTDVGNATGTNDNACATTNAGNGPIQVSNFGFNIPAGSTITGILVEPKSASGGALPGTTSFGLTLLKAGSTAGSTITVTITADSASVCSDATFLSGGASSNLWGTTWTPNDINNSGFGVNIQGGGSPDVFFLDAVRVTVFYDPPTSTPTPTNTATPTATPTLINVGPPVPASTQRAPAEVPEADTLLLLGGGIGGLATWVGRQWRARKRVSR